MLGEKSLSWAELLAASPAEHYARLEAAGFTGSALRTVQEELGVLRDLSEHGGLAAAGRRLRAARALVEIRERSSREREMTRTELRGR